MAMDDKEAAETLEEVSDLLSDASTAILEGDKDIALSHVKASITDLQEILEYLEE